MKVLSLYDGMSGGYIALRECGLEPTEYTAYEMDKHAIKVSSHNFPIIEHRGEIFPDTDFTEFEGIDFVMGGSPCTFWSIAQSPDKRETTASGLGWELFQYYVRAVEQAKPKYFIYENNKSMSKEIRRCIDEAFGFEATLINSALLSAQNRNRLYWVGKRNALGEYDRVKVSQPEDLGILVKDILDSGLCYKDKADVLTASYNGAALWNSLERHQRTMVAEPTEVFDSCDGGVPIGTPRDKAHTVTARHGRGYTNFRGYSVVAEPICVNAQSGDRYGKRTQPSVYDRIYSDEGKAPAVHTGHKPSVASNMVFVTPMENGEQKPYQQNRCYSVDHKGVTLKANGGGQGANTGLYAEPIQLTEEGKSRPIQASYFKYAASDSFKDTNPRSAVAEPINLTSEGKAGTIRATCYKDGIRNIVGNEVDKRTAVAEPVCLRPERTEQGKLLRKDYEAGTIEHGYSEHKELQPRTDGKTNTITTVTKDNYVAEPIDEVGLLDNDRIGAITAYEDGSFRPHRGDDKSTGISEIGKVHTPNEKSYTLTTTHSPTIVEQTQVYKVAHGYNKGGFKAQEKSDTVRASAFTDNFKIVEEAQQPRVNGNKVYEVKDGRITLTIKGEPRTYDIKLKDGYYIIRKLSVSECARLQTVPDWYDFSPISATQAYKCLGNGWTIRVIQHLIEACMRGETMKRPAVQQSLFDFKW